MFNCSSYLLLDLRVQACVDAGKSLLCDFHLHLQRAQNLLSVALFKTLRIHHELFWQSPGFYRCQGIYSGQSSRGTSGGHWPARKPWNNMSGSLVLKWWKCSKDFELKRSNLLHLLLGLDQVAQLGIILTILHYTYTGALVLHSQRAMKWTGWMFVWCVSVIYIFPRPFNIVHGPCLFYTRWYHDHYVFTKSYSWNFITTSFGSI